MSKALKLFWVIALAAVIGLPLASCGGSSSPAGGDLDSRFFGRWVMDNDNDDECFQMYFRQNGTVRRYFDSTYSDTQVWSTNGNRLIMGGEIVTFSVNNDGSISIYYGGILEGILRRL